MTCGMALQQGFLRVRSCLPADSNAGALFVSSQSPLGISQDASLLIFLQMVWMDQENQSETINPSMPCYYISTDQGLGPPSPHFLVACALIHCRISLMAFSFSGPIRSSWYAPGNSLKVVSLLEDSCRNCLTSSMQVTLSVVP